jgi:hypothetical protein
MPGQVIEFRARLKQSPFMCLCGLGHRVLEEAIIALTSPGIVTSVKGLHNMRC